jgi:hypothetical protein
MTFDQMIEMTSLTTILKKAKSEKAGMHGKKLCHRKDTE